MKTLFKPSIAILCFLLTFNLCNGQALMPQASSSQTLVQDFGLGKVTLTYGRPNMNNRKIFGGLEPYGAVWRTGANEAPKLTFTDEVSILGNKIPAGSYSLFTVPNKNMWTVILNKTADQWGDYDYKMEDDILRIEIKPSIINPSVETFSMLFSEVKLGKMNLDLMWENTLISIPMEVDFDAKVIANIQKAMASDKKPYFAAAQYYYNNNKDIKQALLWINEAEKTDQKAPWYKYWKAKILLKSGDKVGAIATAKTGAALAKAINNQEYVNLNESVIEMAK
jgi:hypothetical protein